jgi:hypothetical protein
MLKIKYIIAIYIHDYDYLLSIYFYINVLLYNSKLIIIQFQVLFDKENSLKILILYNFFIFNLTKWKYSIYKKKLCVLIKFVLQYDYFCKHLRNIIIICVKKTIKNIAREISSQYSRARRKWEMLRIFE